jgi:hypothetical protein
MHVTCSKSGKLTKSHIKYWAQENYLLFLDLCSGQTDPRSFVDAFDENIQCEVFQIPPKTKADIQACNKYFFRQWKYLYQRCFDRLAIDQLKIDLKSRDSILKLHALIHNQLSSDRFSLMIKYACTLVDIPNKNLDNYKMFMTFAFPS